MIKSFQHKGLEKFFMTGEIKGIEANHAKRLRLILAILDALTILDDFKQYPSLEAPLARIRRQRRKLVVDADVL